MPTNPTYIAKVLATGKTIEVYKHADNGTYIDFADCHTEYTKEELQILETKK